MTDTTDMRDLKDLAITKSILHILDHRDENKLFNEFELELTSKVETLFKKHIINSIKDEKTRVAKFETSIENSVQRLFQKLLEDDSDFVYVTQQIAEHLYQAMRSKISAAPANCVICVYTANDKKYAALLKMDFSESIQTKTIQIDGKTKIVLDFKDKGVPNSQQKLRKCAFVKQYSDENEYDMILLDKDKRDEGVADFFANTFLKANLTHNNVASTRGIIKETEKFINETYKNDVGEARRKRSIFFEMLNDHVELDVKVLADVMFAEEKVKEAYMNKISKTVGDYSFEIDKPFMQDNLVKKVIQTNTGVDINIDNSTFEDSDKFEIIEKNDTNEVDILIKNVTYTEKSL